MRTVEFGSTEHQIGIRNGYMGSHLYFQRAQVGTRTGRGGEEDPPWHSGKKGTGCAWGHCEQLGLCSMLSFWANVGGATGLIPLPLVHAGSSRIDHTTQTHVRIEEREIHAAVYELQDN